jgi:hypothetical protein
MEPLWTPAKARYQAPGANLRSTPVEIPAAVRARWLAELATALEQAEHLLKRLAVGGRYDPMIVELELRIGAAKCELESLRTSRPPRAESSPRWIDFPPWEHVDPIGG